MLIGFDLLDRQIVDRDGEPVGKVDDVELTYDADGTARRLSGAHHRPPQRIGMDLVAEISSAITLSVRRELLLDPPLEAWLRDHLIGRIPGAGHES